MPRVIRNLKIGVSGVRGTVDEGLSVRLVAEFAAVFGTFAGPGRVVVGRDTRASGPMIEMATAAGLIAVGCEPLLAGVVPTPTVQILVSELRAAGGISISASHNPPSWNALKFIGPRGVFLDSGETAALLNMYNQGDADLVDEGAMRASSSIPLPFEPHKRRIFANVDCEAIRARRFKVAMDMCNGAGAPFAAAFLEELGCEVIALFDSCSGVFEREPEPRPENLERLCKAVARSRCDIGFAQDPDADRLAIVAPDGSPVGENYSVVMAVSHVLSKTPGPVVVNAATSKAVEEVARARGCPTFYTRVGEINVVSKMLETGAVVGGESNGGVIWPAVHPCRDSFAGMALALDMLATTGLGLESILASLPRYHAATEKLDASPEQARRAVAELRRRHADGRVSLVDGVRIDWDDRWVLARPSNTEPIIRIQAEARTPEAAADLARGVRRECERLL